jgi:Glycosyl transferase family 11
MTHELAERETSPDSQKLFIITGRPGRMGNRLLLFAHFIAFAEEHGYRVRNFTFQTYAKFFVGTCRDIYCEYPVREGRRWLSSVPGLSKLVVDTRFLFRAARLVRLLNRNFSLLGRSVVNLEQLPGGITLLDGPEVQSLVSPAKTVIVNGWRLRAPESLRKHAEKVRRYFDPVPEIEQKVRLLMERVRQNAQVVVGVHIRHTDYRRWRGGKYFFPASRYAEWMRGLPAQFSGAKVSFLVCSDEPRSQEEFPGLSVVLSQNSPIEDLYALAQCDYVLGPMSTFSQWASFQGDKPLLHLHHTDDQVDREKFRVSWLED